jgi:hypothetical protein
VRRLRYLLALDGQARYDALQGRSWGLVDWLAASRSFTRPMPAWRFWPMAVVKWPAFDRQQRRDERRRVAA